MYLSKIVFELSRKVSYMLRTPYEQHRTIMRGFSDGVNREAAKVLYRFEKSSTGLVFFVQSQILPNWDGIRNFTISIQSKEFNPQFIENEKLWFKLRANTVKTKCRENGKKFKEPIVGKVPQMKWLEEKGIELGFSFLSEDVSVFGDNIKFNNPSKNGATNQVVLVVGDFEGCLQVLDVEKFTKSVINGIGPAKYVGLGMMCSAPRRF